jgi:hypothetical protein
VKRKEISALSHLSRPTLSGCMAACGIGLRFRRPSATPCSKKTVGHVRPQAMVLTAVTDRRGEACEGRATLGVAKLGIVGDVSD